LDEDGFFDDEEDQDDEDDSDEDDKRPVVKDPEAKAPEKREKGWWRDGPQVRGSRRYVSALKLF
jgi:hypothetical protein